jgi:hypothetical protein
MQASIRETTTPGELGPIIPINQPHNTVRPVILSLERR